MEDIKKIFWKNLRYLREKNWYSQEELWHLAWLHRTYISEVERWLKNISIENVQKIAMALHVPISDLFK